MNDNSNPIETITSRLKMYESNQVKLIKALVKKIREVKRLQLLNANYALFLTDEQIKAANIMTIALMKKVEK